MTDEFTPIERYGLIGNLETCALVGPDGSVDWLPFPHIESPSVFARILDLDRGGHFRVGPVPDRTEATSRRYLPRTNVLETTFETPSGTLELVDFMPVSGDERTDGPRALCRRVACTDGTVGVDVTFRPRFDYARGETSVAARDGDVIADGERAGDRLRLADEFRHDVRETGTDGEATATAVLDAADVRWLVLAPDEDAVWNATGDPEALLDRTVDYWRNWAHTCGATSCVFGGPWHDLIVRSALTLKLHTHPGTGAIYAAPTTSIPEEIGGVRNWDYRYSWIRDAGQTVQALVNLNHTEEARAYIEWFLDLCETNDPGELRPLYGLHGERDLEERQLGHLSGYRHSRPVRIGNGAADQRQLDIYGELVLAVSLADRKQQVLHEDEWPAIRDLIDHVTRVWDEPDAGIWEVRGGTYQFVHSKVMCWVALDRGIALAERRGFDAPTGRWRTVRDEIRRTVFEKGYDDERDTFVQAFDRPGVLDATALLMPKLGIIDPGDERVRSTIDAIRERLGRGDGLLHRYDGDDGLPGEEGAFLFCSFWLVDALALAGRTAEARDVLRSVLDYAGPLGLLAEEVDPATGEQLGNYPQAFSHIGLINAVLYLRSAEAGAEFDFGPLQGRVEDASD